MRLKTILCALFAFLLNSLPHAFAITLEQIIPREHPSFTASNSVMAVGCDGKVYLSSAGQNTGYVLRVTRDGSDKIGGSVVYATTGVTANKEGQIGVASAHFAHTVTFYNKSFEKTVAMDDFLVNDAVGWDAPSHVEAGESGDFYGMDQHRDRILRISPEGRLLQSYSIPHSPDGTGGLIEDFRVNERLEKFYVMTRQGPLRAIGFDGQLKWSTSTSAGWLNGGFDVDEKGVLYSIGLRDEFIKKFDVNGHPAGEIKLQMGEAQKPGATGPFFRGLRVFGDEVLLKRDHPTELFQRYALESGKLLNVVNADHERLSATYDKTVWIAGESVPFSITFDSGPRTIKPHWRIWLRPLNAPFYRELKFQDGKVLVPADAAGIYQIKVSPETQPLESGKPSEYVVRGWIEIRKANSRGTVNVMSPQNRMYYAMGEAIPLSVLVRSSDSKSVSMTVQLCEKNRPDRVLAQTTGTADANGVLALTLPATLTSVLKAGDYIVTANAVGFTSVPQYLTLGRGDDGTNFLIVRHGDYGETYPAASLWRAPDVVRGYITRESKLGFNLHADRIGTTNQIGALEWSGQSASDVNSLVKRLDSDASGVAPDKVRTSSILHQVMAAYSAHGLSEMPILLYMDAGLPLGTGFDKRTPQQMQDAIARVTKAFDPYPSYRGWTWHSNWWVFDKTGSNAAKTPEEKAAYEAALRDARQTGKWSEVLDRVAGYRLDYAVQAQDLFAKALRAASARQDLITASAGTYRNVQAYPPISFSNVDEVDLQGQFEQIMLPYFPPHAVDFYRRPGKPVWGHPEVWNDAGTGEQIMPQLFSMFMRGADGTGLSGNVPPWSGNGQSGAWRDDPRLSHFGTLLIIRAANDLFKRYGAWLRTLRNDDQIAIAVSGRPFKIDEWASVTGCHFARVMEAWVSCLQAHHPASFVFAEDVNPDSFKKYKAVLVVDQTVEMEPQLAVALKNAQEVGTKVFADGTCRPELVKEYSSLGIAFNRFEKDPHPASDDAAYLRFPRYVKANLSALQKALDGVSPTTARIENPEVWTSQFTNGGAKYLFLVNNTALPLGPGQVWRTTLLESSRLPVVAPVQFSSTPPAIYDVLDLKEVTAQKGVLSADLRNLPLRIYALLPSKINGVALRGPSTLQPGQSFKWWAQVRDRDDKAIAAAVPLRVRLLEADGSTLSEQFVSSDVKGVGGEMVAPLNAAANVITIEATELFCGHSARLTMALKTASLPVTFDKKYSAAHADESGKSVKTDVVPTSQQFGPHLRDLVVLESGKIAVINANNWDNNLYGIDCESGKMLWHKKVGHYFSFAPQAVIGGFVAQGFDYNSAEGYHLNLGDDQGRVVRRFALYGLPRRLPHRFVPGLFNDRDNPINNFAIPSDGSWVASSGDLGLVVWSRDGKELWREDWWKTRRGQARLDASDGSTLLVARGGKSLEILAYDAKSGKVKWKLDLAPTGTVQRIVHSSDGNTQAFLTDCEGGRVFVVRGGKVVSTLPTAGLDVQISPDGKRIGIIEENTIKMYNVNGGLQWSYAGDDVLRAPRFSSDGKRIAVGSEIGTLYVLDGDGMLLHQQDNGALSVPAWLPNGDLLLANWMGKLTRLGLDYKPKWSTLLNAPNDSDTVAGLTKVISTPTVRVADWGNAEDTPLPITPNLLAETKAVISVAVNGRNWVQFSQPYAALTDGNPDAAEKPWLGWSDVNSLAEGEPQTTIVLDAFRTQMHVEGITFYEDPDHPESWLRDAKLEYWDAKSEQWKFAANLLSDSAIHSHKLPQAVETGKLRIVIPPGLFGNIRWGEIVVHGQALGASHPDVVAKHGRALLFDDSEAFKNIYPYADRWGFDLNGAFSGGRFLRINANQTIAPTFVPPYGHAVPTWDFEIAQAPQPGQYRYLQFAVKALSPETKGATLRLENKRLHVGVVGDEDYMPAVKVGDTLTTDWQTVRVDLWDVFRKPIRLQSLFFTATGGAVGFDQIVLGRTLADLPATKN